jgi:ADP-heptose:LPS heptosyltransferase
MRLLAAAAPPRARGRGLRFAQRIEDVARLALLQVVVQTARLLFGRSERVPAAPRRVLFICEDAIGDLILTLPAIRAIAESRPDTTVDLVTSEYAVDLVRHLPYVNRVIVFPRYDRRRLGAAWAIARYGAYDAVIDGMVLRSHVRTRSIAMMTGARSAVWVGESGRTSDYVYSIRIPPCDPLTPHAERMMHLARPFLGDAPDGDTRARLALSDAEQETANATWDTARGSGDRILVNLSASCWQRRWSDANFATVLDQIRALRPSAPLIIVGLQKDAQSVATLAEQSGACALVPTLRELMALIATADVVLSPDTAVCHMAAAFERTLISLNLLNHENWATAPTPGARVVGPNEETFEGLDAPAVVEAVTRVLCARPGHVSLSAYTSGRDARVAI